MRLAILTSFVLLPVLAHGQASTPAAAKPIPASAAVHAELTQPAALAAAVNAAAAADTATSISTLKTAGHPAVRQFVQTLVTEDFVHQALRKAGTLESGFMGGDVTDGTAPRMTRSVEIQLSEQELAAVPEVTQVAVSGTVDEYGFVRNLTVTRSAGKAIDQKALASVSEFRYKPATVGNQPVDAAVTVSIQLKKQ